jgi:hypothetical protein
MRTMMIDGYLMRKSYLDMKSKDLLAMEEQLLPYQKDLDNLNEMARILQRFVDGEDNPDRKQEQQNRMDAIILTQDKMATLLLKTKLVIKEDMRRLKEGYAYLESRTKEQWMMTMEDYMATFPDELAKR